MVLLVLTEDSGKEANDTLASLVKRIALHQNPDCKTHHLQFTFPEGQVKKACRANAWKGSEVHLQRLAKSILTYLGQGNAVLMHVDGDTRWSKRDKSENRTKLQDRLISKLKGMVDALNSNHASSRPTAQARRRVSRGASRPIPPPISPSQLERDFVLLVPYYSIESWLFLNADSLQPSDHPQAAEAKTILRKHLKEHKGFDEQAKPKDLINAKSKLNAILAKRSFPVQAAVDKSPSF